MPSSDPAHPYAPPVAPKTAVASRPRVRRRQLRRRRRSIGVLVLLGPMLWLLLSDLWRRFDQIMTFDRVHSLGYVATIGFSGIFWAVILYVASRQRGILRQAAAGLFAVLYTLAAGVQGAFHGFWGTYLCLDSQKHSKSLLWSLFGYVPLYRVDVVLHLLWALALAITLLVLARRYVKPRRIVRSIIPILLPVVLVAMVLMPASYRTWQSSSPDLIYFHGYVALVKERLRMLDDAPHLRVQRRNPEPVPPLNAKPTRQRNVLLILQESVRYDVACNEYLRDDSQCATPFSNRAAPNRMALNQLRANAATTAISISDIWSGVPSTEGPGVLLTVPLIWEYAQAADYDTAYWTSQHAMFGSTRLYIQDIPVSHFAVATNIDPRADFDAGADDGALTDRALSEWSELEEPFLAVVHYSNGHYPYKYDENHAPFQPAKLDKSAGKNEEFFNYFKNVLYLSDMAVGRLIKGVRQSPSGPRTVIIYTSDHAESFREHHQLGHTSSLYDEEIHVPAWIDAPEGTLTTKEREAIKGAKEQFIWHLDLAPTMLDLLGLWDRPPLRRFRARMIGHPLTRPQRTVGPVPLNNCSWVWECAFRNWGMMQGHIKIEAREWHDEFHCFDLLADPQERTNLGEQACAPLPDIARAWFGAMPLREPPRKKNLLWGRPAPTASTAASAK